jgi:hypothetical protein
MRGIKSRMRVNGGKADVAYFTNSDKESANDIIRIVVGTESKVCENVCFLACPHLKACLVTTAEALFDIFMADTAS